MSVLQLKLCSSSLVIIITGFFTRKLNLCITLSEKIPPPSFTRVFNFSTAFQAYVGGGGKILRDIKFLQAFIKR